MKLVLSMCAVGNNQIQPNLGLSVHNLRYLGVKHAGYWAHCKPRIAVYNQQTRLLHRQWVTVLDVLTLIWMARLSWQHKAVVCYIRIKMR